MPPRPRRSGRGRSTGGEEARLPACLLAAALRLLPRAVPGWRAEGRRLLPTCLLSAHLCPIPRCPRSLKEEGLLSERYQLAVSNWVAGTSHCSLKALIEEARWQKEVCEGRWAAAAAA